MTRSASGSSTATASNAAARPPTRSARSCALSSVRLETTTSAPAALQVPRGQLAHLPGAEQQRALALGAPELADAELDRGGRNRLRQLVQLRLGAHALAGAQGVLEQPVQQRTGRAARASRLVGVPHLAEDLRLARDERVEPGRDAEEMRDGLAVVPAGEKPFELEPGALLESRGAPARGRRRAGRSRCGCRSRARPPRRAPRPARRRDRPGGRAARAPRAARGDATPRERAAARFLAKAGRAREPRAMLPACRG